MKKIIYIILALISFSLRAENRVQERVFLTTDRPVYIAGDRVWCSAFCIDLAKDGKLSDLSSIAYVELHSAEGMVQTARIALLGGRGAGDIMLKSDLPTGNYRLVAYTKAGLNEDGIDFSKCATTISIFNPSTTARVKDGVKVSDEPAKASASHDQGTLEISCSADVEGKVLPVTIHNNGSALASVSIAVSHDDGIAVPASQDIVSFMSSMRPGTSFTDRFIPEYDGEIIKARVSGISPELADSLAGKFAFISAPGDKADVYSSPIAADGTATFFTNNIFGDKDLVCEIEGLPSKSLCHLEVVSPFQDVAVGEIPQLSISSKQKDALMRRKSYQQIENGFDNDILYGFMPYRANRIFGQEVISYVLDDYTRFPLMSEVLVEITPELRARSKKEGGSVIQIRLQELFQTTLFSQDESLVLLDGTPIFDHSKIMSYDPMLVEKINVYPYTYFIGSRAYQGVVDFVTFKKNLPSMDFNSNVRVVSFQGASLPMSYTCQTVSSDYPDYRQVAYWHPLVDVKAGESVSFDCNLPDYAGSFTLTVEGVTVDGKPVKVVRRITSSSDRSRR